MGEFSAGLAALDRLGLQPEVVTHSAETGIGYPGTRGDRSHLDVLLNDPRLGNVPAVSNADPTEGLFDLPEAPDVSEETDWDMMGGKGKGEVDFGSDDDPLADFPSYEATYEPPEADEPFDADNYSVKDLPVSEETLNRFKTLLHYRDDAAPADKEGNGPGYQGEMSSLVDKKLVPQWKMSEHIQLFPAFPTYHHLAENTDFSVQEKMQYLDQLKAFSDGGYKLILPDGQSIWSLNE